MSKNKLILGITVLFSMQVSAANKPAPSTTRSQGGGVQTKQPSRQPASKITATTTAPKPAEAPSPQTNDFKSKGKNLRGLKNDEIFRVKPETKVQIDQLRNTLNGYYLLYKNEKDPIKKLKIKVTVALTHFNIAKALIYDSPKGKEAATKDLDAADKYFTEALAEKNLPQDEKGKAQYYKGLVLLEKNDATVAREYFVQALNSSPVNEASASMNLFIAENYFENDKFAEALKFYMKGYSKYNSDQKSLAIYKSGWCYLNLQKFPDAEKMFLTLVGQKWAKDFSKDSIKDLAYVETQFKTEGEIIIFAKQNLSRDTSIMYQFLLQALDYLQSQKSTVKYAMLFNELLKLQPTIEGRLALYLKQLKFHQKEYASTEPFLDFLTLRKYLIESKASPAGEKYKTFFLDLEGEIEKIVKTHTEAFTNKVKSPEKIERITIEERLKALLEFHLYYFPGSKNRAISFQLLLDLCSSKNDAQCTLTTGKRILADPTMGQTRPRAYLEMLKVQEELAKADNRLKAELLTTMASFLKELPEDPQWNLIAKKYTAILIEDKKMKEALPYLTTLHKKENSTQSLYRLAMAQYEEQNYDWLLKLPLEPANDEHIKKITELVRESSLKVANASLAKNDFEAYEKYLGIFLNLNKDEGKADAAKKDWYSRLFEQKSFDRLYDELKKNPAIKLFTGPFKDLNKALIDQYLSVGNFAKVLDLLSPIKLGQHKDFDTSILLANFASTGRISDSHLKTLSTLNPGLQDYLAGLLIIFSPEQALTYFNSIKKQTPEHKQAIYLLYRLNETETEFKIDKDIIAQLAEVLPPALVKSLKKTNSENKAALIQFPKFNKYNKKAETQFAQVIEQVRGLRKSFMADLKDQTVESQMRILDTAITIETRTAEMLTGSPTPDSLSDEQKLDYEKGLVEMANEFVNQTDEYVKVKNSILSAERMQKERDNRLVVFEQVLPNWTWPPGEIGQVLAQLEQTKNGPGAMVVLDLAKAHKKISDKDYSKSRAKILLSYRMDESMADYAYQEIMTANHKDLFAGVKFPEPKPEPTLPPKQEMVPESKSEEKNGN